MTRISSFLTDKAIPLMLFLLLLGVWPLRHLSNLTVDNAIDVWLDHHSKEYQEYLEFQREYGGDEWVLVAFSLHEVPPEQRMSQIRAVAEDLKRIGQGIDVIAVSTIGDPRSEALRHILLSDDEGTTGILLRLPEMGEMGNRPALIERIEIALSPYTTQYSFHLGGPTVVNAELDRTSEHQVRIFLPLALFITLVSLCVIFRSVSYVLVPVVASGMAVLWTLGIAAGSGMRLNMITTVLPVLLWVLSLAGSIHLLYHVRLRYRGESTLNEAIFGAFQSVFVPYGIASLTTAIGFLSLLSSHMEPVRDLGLYAAVGIGLGFLSNVVLAPGMLKLLGKRKIPRISSRRPPSTGPALDPSIIRRWKWVISASGIALLLISVFAVPSLRVESNVLHFFGEESRILRDFRFISRNLSGLSTIELDFRGNQDDCPPYVYRLTKGLEDIPDIWWTVYPSGENFRMTIFVKTMESMDFNELVHQIRSRMASIPSEGVQVRLTGSVVLLNRVQEELINTQIKSFSIASLTIIALLFVIFRSLRMVLVGSIVNLFPIAILLEMMAIFRIPFNTATIMIASVAIGIAVDDTVFFLVRLRSECAKERNWQVAIDHTFAHLVRPITFTTLVTATGFFVLLLADFKPISFFGLLGGLTMISAWVGDTVILPALLYPLRSPFRGALE